eukprot:scaffold27210_cov31-Attheya_sp.AAC.2
MDLWFVIIEREAPPGFAEHMSDPPSRRSRTIGESRKILTAATQDTGRDRRTNEARPRLLTTPYLPLPITKGTARFFDYSLL